MRELPREKGDRGLKVMLVLGMGLHSGIQMEQTRNLPGSHQLANLPSLSHLVVGAHVNETFPHPINEGVKGEVLGPVVKPELVQLILSLFQQECPGIFSIDLTMQPEVG